MAMEGPDEEKVLDSEKVKECEEQAQKIVRDLNKLKEDLQNLGLQEDVVVADEILEKSLYLMWRAKGNFKFH